MRTGITADHSGFELKEQFSKMLHESGHEVVDFVANKLTGDDAYPDFVLPLAIAVSNGTVQ